MCECGRWMLGKSLAIDVSAPKKSLIDSWWGGEGAYNDNFFKKIIFVPKLFKDIFTFKLEQQAGKILKQEPKQFDYQAH